MDFKLKLPSIFTNLWSACIHSKYLISLWQAFLKLQRERGNYLRSRHLQFLLAFNFWPAIESRKGSNIYEIRSYSLKPGTMIEWGNNWARGLKFRRNNNEAFAGFMSQVGRLNNVHHIWCKFDPAQASFSFACVSFITLISAAALIYRL